VFAVVVIGPPGSGKTRVLTALHDLLADSDVAHAVIEVEAVAWAHPPISDEQSFRHLESICRTYKDAGCELILVGATATSGDYLAALVAAIDADDYLVVRLEADPLTLRERITAREPAEWSGLPRLLDAVDEIALVSSSLEDVHLVYSTEDASPLAVAAQIRRARPEVLGGNAQSPLSDDELTNRWESQGLGGAGVSHIDHVRVAWVLHRRHGALEAEKRLVRGTRKGCDHYGVPEKFDERLTRSWARAISTAIAHAPESETFRDFIARNPELRRGDLLREAS
jgi:hypothetical protein